MRLTKSRFKASLFLNSQNIQSFSFPFVYSIVFICTYAWKTLINTHSLYKWDHIIYSTQFSIVSNKKLLFDDVPNVLWFTFLSLFHSSFHLYSLNSLFLYLWPYFIFGHSSYLWSKECTAPTTKSNQFRMILCLACAKENCNS